MTLPTRAAAVAALLVSACAGAGAPRFARMPVPEGRRALDLDFGAPRAAIEGALARAGIAHRVRPGDPDALVADRCPGAPVAAPCRLVFGPEGLYAAEIEVPPADEAALVRAVAAALGAPARRPEGGDGRPDVLVAAWERPGWAVGVSRLAPEGAAPTAALRIEYERAAPPVVAGVPLGRLRDDVEHALDRQGGQEIARDEGSTVYLGCPLGDPEALTCVVTFRAGRAASVTEVHLTPPGDGPALAAWRDLAAKYEAEIGRRPALSCPAEGPDRVLGDCTASWPSDRLVVTVGAHRNAGGRHRGAISVYTGFTYPPLAPPDGEVGAKSAEPD